MFLRGIGGKKRTVVPVTAGEPVIPEALRIGLYAKDIAHIVALHQQAVAMLRAISEAEKQTKNSLAEVRDALNTQIATLRSLLQPAREVSDRVNELSERIGEPADLVAHAGQVFERRMRSAVETSTADILTCLTDSSARVERCIAGALVGMDQPPHLPAQQTGAAQDAGGLAAQLERGPTGEHQDGSPSPIVEEAPAPSTRPRRPKGSPRPITPEALGQLAAAITAIRTDYAATPEGLLARLRALQDSVSAATPTLLASQWARDKIRQALKAAANDPAKADSILAALLSKIEDSAPKGPASPEAVLDDVVPGPPSTAAAVTGGDGAAGHPEPAATADESGLVIA
jgi:ABC-type transporter Mla subunit MlaD